jgi:hypothetical protein
MCWKEGGALGEGCPLLVKSGYPNGAPPERAIYRKSHPVQVKKAGSIPAQENAPDPVTHEVFTLSSTLSLLSEMVSASMQVSSSSFTADRWQRSLYPEAVRDFLVCTTGDTVYRLHKTRC